MHLNPTLTADTSITIDASVNDRDTGAFITFNELIFAGTGPISITAPTITITATAINIGNRALTLNANGGSLTLNTAITATAGSTGAVMLIATNGVLTLRGDINATSSDIALTGTQGIDLGDINTLTGGAISLTGVIMRDTALTVTATGVLTLNSNINTGTSGLTLTGGTGGIALGGDVELTGSTVSLTGAIDEAAASTDGLTIMATGNITLNSDIDLGMGALDLRAGVGSTTGNILNGDTARTIISGALFLQQTSSFENDLFDFATSRASGAVSLRISSAVGQEIYRWIVDLSSGDLSIQGVGGVTLTSISRPLGALTRSAGTLDLRAATVTLGPTTTATGITIIADTIVFVNLANSISATAGNVALTGTIDNSFQGLTINAVQSTGSIVFNSAAITLSSLVVNSNHALEVNANGTLTLNSNINTGTSALTLTGGTGGTGGIVLGGDVVLTGAAINLTGAINETINTRNLTIMASGVLTLNDNINLGTGDLIINATGGTTLGGGVVLTADEITLTGDITSVSNALTITAATSLTLNSDINTGTGDLTLDVGVSSGTFGAARTLSGNLVTIDGSRILLADGNLTISALGNLIVDVSIAAGANTLRLEAGRGAGQTSSIMFMLSDMEGLQADNYILVQNGAVFPATRPAIFQSGAGSPISDTGNPSAIRLLYDGTETQDPVAWAFNVPPMISLGRGETFEVAAANFTGGVLATTVSITLNAGRGRITFASGLPNAITLRAPTITITAGMINIGTRTLTLMASTGALTLNLSAGMTITGTGAAALSVSGDTIAGLSRELILNVPTVSLRLTGDDSSFGRGSRPFAAASGITTLNITTVADQTYRGWMAGTNRNLTLDTRGVITIGAAAINLGTGNLFFGGANLILTNPAGLTITAGNFQFTGGAIGPQDGVDVPQFVVIASGDIILDSTIQLPTARVEFRADTGNIMPAADRAGLGIDPPLIMANSLFMRQMGAFADDLINTASRVSGEVSLRISTAVAQTIHPWMLALGGTDFQLRGVGVALTSITSTAALTRTGRIDLRATDITLGGALTGSEVRLRANTITGPGALLAIHAMTSDIDATSINSDGTTGTSRPALTNATSFSLTQGSAFGGRGRLPFTFDDAVITAITLSTRSEQVVLNWMIRQGTSLTITSSDRVVVDAAIGSGDRDLDNGSLTLTSTGGVVRILENISTGGNITLIGGTGGINFNGRAAKTLSGAAITLRGDARSNRDLTLTATNSGGALTLSGEIVLTGTSALGVERGRRDHS